jgi:putative ATP-grasp target RiPP
MKDISSDGAELSEAELQEVAGGKRGPQYATNNRRRSATFLDESEKVQREMDVDESIAPILD